MSRPGLWEIAVLGALLIFALATSAQTSSKSNPQPAANAWMLVPTPYLEWNRDVSPEIRAARDGYMDQVTPPVFAASSDPPQRIPLTSPDFHEYVTPSGCDGAASGPEIRDYPNRAIVIGRFINHHSVLSRSGYSLYTEITLSVEQVFENQTGSHSLSPQQEITVVVPGGTVALPSNRTLTYLTRPREWSLQPNRIYLLLLSYHGEGEFYFVMGDWEVSDGAIRPNDCRTVYWARTGRSSLNGLPTQQLGPALDKILHPNR